MTKKNNAKQNIDRQNGCASLLRGVVLFYATNIKYIKNK